MKTKSSTKHLIIHHNSGDKNEINCERNNERCKTSEFKNWLIMDE